MVRSCSLEVHLKAEKWKVSHSPACLYSDDVLALKPSSRSTFIKDLKAQTSFKWREMQKQQECASVVHVTLSLTVGTCLLPLEQNPDGGNQSDQSPIRLAENTAAQELSSDISCLQHGQTERMMNPAQQAGWPIRLPAALQSKRRHIRNRES